MADTRSFGLPSEIHEYLVAHGTRPDAVLRDLIEETKRLLVPLGPAAEPIRALADFVLERRS